MLDEDGSNALVQAGILPYADSIAAMRPRREFAVENTVVYPGTLDSASQFIIVPRQCVDLCGVRMTGARIREIMAKKYDPSGRTADFDSGHYGPCSCVCVTGDGQELRDDQEYLTAVPAMALTENVWSGFAEIVMVRDGSGILTASTVSGIRPYFAERPVINTKNMVIQNSAMRRRISGGPGNDFRVRLDRKEDGIN